MMRMLADCAEVTMEIECADDTDFDSTFRAVDIDTGEVVRINGWLWTFEAITDTN